MIENEFWGSEFYSANQNYKDRLCLSTILSLEMFFSFCLIFAVYSFMMLKYKVNVFQKSLKSMIFQKICTIHEKRGLCYFGMLKLSTETVFSQISHTDLSTYEFHVFLKLEKKTKILLLTTVRLIVMLFDFFCISCLISRSSCNI